MNVTEHAERCCANPDPVLVSEAGYECLECGRVIGHRLPPWANARARALVTARKHARRVIAGEHQTTLRQVPHYPRDPGHYKWCQTCQQDRATW